MKLLKSKNKAFFVLQKSDFFSGDVAETGG